MKSKPGQDNTTYMFSILLAVYICCFALSVNNVEGQVCSNVPNCYKCASPPVCDECINVTLVGPNCEACDPNCKICQVAGPGRCDANACNDGFQLLGDNTCQACGGPGCKVCIDSATCSDCLDGYIPNSVTRTCDAIESTTSVLTVTSDTQPTTGTVVSDSSSTTVSSATAPSTVTPSTAALASSATAMSSATPATVASTPPVTAASGPPVTAESTSPATAGSALPANTAPALPTTTVPALATGALPTTAVLPATGVPPASSAPAAPTNTVPAPATGAPPITAAPPVTGASESPSLSGPVLSGTQTTIIATMATVAGVVGIGVIGYMINQCLKTSAQAASRLGTQALSPVTQLGPGFGTRVFSPMATSPRPVYLPQQPPGYYLPQQPPMYMTPRPTYAPPMPRPAFRMPPPAQRFPMPRAYYNGGIQGYGRNPYSRFY